VTPCPVCGAATKDAFSKDGIAYRDCTVCSFRFSVQRANANLEQGIQQFEPAYLQYLAADPAAEGTLGHVLKAAGVSAGTWLDVGCGGGTMVRALTARGFAAEGVEPNDALFGHFLAGDDRFHHDLGEVAGRRFDVVSALDVLEHVPDPVPFLRSLAGAVAPQGVVLVSTPDAGSLAARALGKRWHHYNRYHSSFFAPATLERAASHGRLRVVSTSHPGRTRPLGYAVRYLFEFGLRRDPPQATRRLDRVKVPINLFDTMLAVLRPHAS
jgi:SAM-dependent methyltransferase